MFLFVEVESEEIERSAAVRLWRSPVSHLRSKAPPTPLRPRLRRSLPSFFVLTLRSPPSSSRLQSLQAPPPFSPFRALEAFPPSSSLHSSKPEQEGGENQCPSSGVPHGSLQKGIKYLSGNGVQASNAAVWKGCAVLFLPRLLLHQQHSRPFLWVEKTTLKQLYKSASKKEVVTQRSNRQRRGPSYARQLNARPAWEDQCKQEPTSTNHLAACHP